jgi:hypothetical protein
MRAKQNTEIVDVVARRIHYDLISDDLHTSTSDLQIVEPDQPVPEATSTEPRRVSVEFDADMPASVVVHVLRTMLDTIEKHGLPKLVTKMKRANADRLMKVQKRIATLSKQVAKLPPELRDAFDQISKQQDGWVGEGGEISIRSTKSTKINMPD